MNKNNMDSSDLELVRTEIEILKICQHPYIIKLYIDFEDVKQILIKYINKISMFIKTKKRKKVKLK